MLSFSTEVREQTGKGASRRLRHQNKIPATLYGGKQQPIALALNQDAVNNAEAKAEFYRNALILTVNGAETKVKVQAVQRHPFKPKLTHIDFLRIE